jgi:probable phosphoglycerate mutase
MTLKPPASIRTLSSEAPTTRIVLVRHGEPIAAVRGIVGGPTGDVGLTEAGREQVAVLASRLAASREVEGATALYASTLPRALETAAILAPALGGLEVVVRHDLREHDAGELDGLSWDEVADRFEMPDFDHEPHLPIGPGGESLTAFHERVRAVLAELAEAHRGEIIVIACHGGVIAAGVGLVFGLPASARVALPTKYASMTDVEVTDRGWRLGRYNDRYPVR